MNTMIRNSPSFKDLFMPTPTPTPTPEQDIGATDPEYMYRENYGLVHEWSIKHRFSFPPPPTSIDNIRTGTHEVPRQTTPLYTLISQYNPWLDCEMTREKRAFLKPRAGEMCYPVYCGTGGSSSSQAPNFFRNETIMDIVNLYLWPLLHSRADEVVACRTFAGWQRLFTQTISLAFPDYEYWQSQATDPFVSVSDQRRTARILKYMTPARVLYLLTTGANLWPYGASSPPSSSRNTGGGLCSIKPKITDYADKTEIDWLVSPEFLRKMKRVHMYIAPNTLATAGTSSSIYDTTDDDE